MKFAFARQIRRDRHTVQLFPRVKRDSIAGENGAGFTYRVAARLFCCYFVASLRVERPTIMMMPSRFSSFVSRI
ncbi:MAG: hypothetical protein ACREQV_11880, partial [Candidatus Binatia bacterium]